MADLERLLESAVGEEHDFLEAHQRRTQFYSSLISAVLAATVGGALQANEPVHFYMLLTGPVLVISLSVLALGGTFRLYQRFLEAVVLRAKLEQALGLHDLRNQGEGCYWRGEPLLAPRHLKARKKFSESQAFVDAHRASGYQLYTRWLFVVFAGTGAVLALLLLTAAASHA